MSAIEALFASPWLWLVAGAVLIGLEILAPGVFLLWIGLGAVLVGVSVWVAPDLAVAWQLLIFALAMLGSIALGLVLQRRGRESLSAATLNRELNALIGRRVEAIEDFHNGRGRVRVGDSSYTATSGEPLAAGQLLEVVGLDESGGLIVRLVVGR